MDPTRLADVIERAQRRDPAAFETLIETYSRRVYGFLYRLTGHRDEADDLLQEVFVRVVRTIGEYEHDGRFEAWLFRIAMNLARDRVRRVRKSPQVRIADVQSADREDTGVELLERSPVDQPGPEETVALSEQIDRLQQALGELSPAEREVILLRYFSDMPFSDIARVMDTPLGTALARAHRGLRRLRDILERQPKQ